MKHDDSNVHQCETCTEVPFCLCLCHKPSIGDSLIVYSSVLQLIVAFQSWLLQGCLQLRLNVSINLILTREELQKGVF